MLYQYTLGPGDGNLARLVTCLGPYRASLGVVYGSCVRMPGTGKVSWTMTGNGGAVDTQGTAVPEWVGQFLRDPDQEDVLGKLQRSDAAERHAFIFVVLGGAPRPVEVLL